MTEPYISPALDTLRAQVTGSVPDRTTASDGWIGDAAHAERTSDHNPLPNGEVNALDITADPRLDPQTLANAVVQDPRVTYVIFNRQINNGSGWRHYTGSNPHTYHIHVSVKPNSTPERWTIPLSEFTLLYPHEGGRLTSAYGPRRHPVTGRPSTHHNGTDIAPPKAGTLGVPVLAPCDIIIAKVVSGRKPGQAASNTTGGSLAPSLSGNGIIGTPTSGPFKVVAMGHFRPTVKVGQRVEQGDVIGYGDLSGQITGPHIHLEVWTSTAYTSHKNPGPYLVKEAPLSAKEVKTITDHITAEAERLAVHLTGVKLGQEPKSGRGFLARLGNIREEQSVQWSALEDIAAKLGLKLKAR